MRRIDGKLIPQPDFDLSSKIKVHECLGGIFILGQSSASRRDRAQCSLNGLQPEMSEVAHPREAGFELKVPCLLKTLTGYDRSYL